MWRKLRKEKGPSMSNLPEIIQSFQAEAASMCTQCLIDHIAVESDELNEKLSELNVAEILRGSTHDGEAKYAEMFGNVMSSVLMLAMYTAELTTQRDVEWRDTDAILIVQISPN